MTGIVAGVLLALASVAATAAPSSAALAYDVTLNGVQIAVITRIDLKP